MRPNRIDTDSDFSRLSWTDGVCRESSREPLMDFLETAGPTLFAERLNEMTAQTDRQDGDGLEYALGALRTIAASAHDASAKQLAAVAQAGIDLATKGVDQCAEKRGDASPTRDAAEGAFPIGEDTPYWRTLRAALVLPVEEQYTIAKDLAANCGYELTGDDYTATPQPAPDAMREALVRDQDVLRRYMRHEKDATVRTSANQVLHEIKAALSAPVPPADGAAIATLNGLDQVTAYMRRNDPAVYNMEDILGTLTAGLKRLRSILPPSATGAAEPTECELVEAEIARANEQDAAISASEAEFMEKLSATPPVRGDREAIIRILKSQIRTASPADDIEAHVINAEQVADAILSLPVQPGAGERENIAGSVQCILAKELVVDRDQEIIGAGPASFKIADRVLSGNW